MKSYEDGYKEGFCEGFQAGLREGRVEKRISDNPYLDAETYNELMREAMERTRRMQEEMHKWHPPMVICRVHQH